LTAIAARVIAAIAVKEGLEAWRGDGCCAPSGLSTLQAGTEPADGQDYCACCN
jgi:hypothetical protein